MHKTEYVMITHAGLIPLLVKDHSFCSYNLLLFFYILLEDNNLPGYTITYHSIYGIRQNYTTDFSNIFFYYSCFLHD